jgi:hypothetical protein
MIQHELIARVREMCRADEQLRAALMYGSFAAGEGDAHSDIEFWLFFDPAARAALDPAAWCARIAPLDLLLVNEFGTHVALFPTPIASGAVNPTSAGPASVASGAVAPSSAASGLDRSEPAGGQSPIASGPAAPHLPAPGPAGPSPAASGSAGPSPVVSGLSRVAPDLDRSESAGDHDPIASGPAGPSPVASGPAGPSSAAPGPDRSEPAGGQSPIASGPAGVSPVVSGPSRVALRPDRSEPAGGQSPIGPDPAGLSPAAPGPGRSGLASVSLIDSGPAGPSLVVSGPSGVAPGPGRSGPAGVSPVDSGPAAPGVGRSGLIRGEFHFATTGDIASVGEWPARGAAVDAMVVVDRDGLLAPVLAALPERAALPVDPDEIADLCGRFANWLVLALHVTARGERLRAQDALGHAARHLLWMARLAEDSTAHWLTPSRAAEAELPARTVAAVAECTPAALWREGRDRWLALLDRTGRPLPAALFARLDALTASA